MDAEHKDMLQKILAHQLEGVMLHFDAMLMYYKQHDKRRAALHKRHFLDESNKYAMTSSAIVDMLGAVLEPRLINANTRAKTTSDNFVDVWRSWEEKTVGLYKNAVHSFPDVKLWKCLLNGACKELRSI